MRVKTVYAKIINYGSPQWKITLDISTENAKLLAFFYEITYGISHWVQSLKLEIACTCKCLNIYVLC